MVCDGVANMPQRQRAIFHECRKPHLGNQAVIGDDGDEAARRKGLADEGIGFLRAVCPGPPINEKDHRSSAAAVGRTLFQLTLREQDVLERLTLGRTNREIAAELFISEKTASVHVSNIKSKLGASGRAEIAAIAVRLRLVSDSAGVDDLRPT